VAFFSSRSTSTSQEWLVLFKPLNQHKSEWLVLFKPLNQHKSEWLVLFRPLNQDKSGVACLFKPLNQHKSEWLVLFKPLKREQVRKGGLPPLSISSVLLVLFIPQCVQRVDA
jgi:hypothetical protein